MKVLKLLLYLVLGVAALVVALGIFAKKDYHIERSIDIKAPKSIVAEQITYFKNFPKWSPWQHIDPNVEITYAGTDGQIGSTYAWKGNDKVGTGKLTLKAVSPDRVDTELSFVEPWETLVPAFFTLKEKDGSTNVTWGVDMAIPFPFNGFAMFTDMDKGIGDDYGRGLENLKKLCETLAEKKKYNGYEVTESDMPVSWFSGIRKTVTFAELPKFFMENTPKAAELTAKGGGKISGNPAGLYWFYDEKAGKTDVATTVPLASEKKIGGGVQVFSVGGQKALTVDFYGAYEKMAPAHIAIDEYMTEKGLRQVPPIIEHYITDPGAEPDTAKWLTKVIYVVEQKPATAQK